MRTFAKFQKETVRVFTYLCSHKSITESATIGTSVVSEKYWTITAAEILNSKALHIMSFELWTVLLAQMKSFYFA